MTVRTGITQRQLQRVTVHWGPQQRRHMALVPLFDAGYKVLGLAGLDMVGAPLWYPGVPLTVERRRLVFRSSLSDASPQWSEAPAEALDHCYFFDTWGAVQVLVPREPGAPAFAHAVNLAGNRIQGERVLDVIFEPALHRVRAFLLRGRWGRRHEVLVFRVRALERAVRFGPAPIPDAAPTVPPAAPSGWMGRLMRALNAAQSTDASRGR